VFGSWADLYAAVSAMPAGQRRVVVDNTLTTFPAIPTGTWTLDSWHFIGAVNWVPYIQIDDGAVIDLSYNAGITFENVYINVLSTSVAPITKAADGGITTVTFRGRQGTSGCWVDVNGGTQPFITTSGAGVASLRVINEGYRFVGNVSTPVINIANTALTTEVVLDENADLTNAHAIDSAVGTTVDILVLDAAVEVPTQTGMLGTVNIVRQASADLVSFDDGVSPALGSSNVQGAVDAAKARIRSSIGSADRTVPLTGGTPEYVVGGFSYDPASDPNIYLEAMSTTASVTATYRLYDMGAPGAWASGVLRSTLTVSASAGRSRVQLTPVGSPGVNADQIHNVERMYELRVVSSATEDIYVNWFGLKVN
jgi:hypothetical protein